MQLSTLLLFALTAASVASGQRAALNGPVEGYVFDAPTMSLRAPGYDTDPFRREKRQHFGHGARKTLPGPASAGSAISGSRFATKPPVQKWLELEMTKMRVVRAKGSYC